MKSSSSIFNNKLFLTGLLFGMLLLTPSIKAQMPGQMGNRVLLPNGWWLSPAGTSLMLSTLPMNAALSPDEHFLAVVHAGYLKPEVMLVYLKLKKVVQPIKLKDSWLGVAFRGEELFVSGGNQDCVYSFYLKNGKLSPSDTLVFVATNPKAKVWVAGLDVRKGTLAVVGRGDNTLRYVHLDSKKYKNDSFGRNALYL